MDEVSVLGHWEGSGVSVLGHWEGSGVSVLGHWEGCGVSLCYPSPRVGLTGFSRQR